MQRWIDGTQIAEGVELQYRFLMQIAYVGEEQIKLLDQLGHASSKAEEGPPEPKTRIGWEEIPSSAPAHRPLPPRS